MQDGEGLHDRVPLDIRAADVQKPCDRIRQRDDRGALPGALQTGGKAGAFRGSRFPGQSVGLHADRPQRRGRPVGPDRIDEIAGRAKGYAAVFKRRLQIGNLFRGMQPGVIGDLPALRQMLLQPDGGLYLGPVDRGEAGKVHLRLDLRPVAPVDEDARYMGQDDAEPGGAGKPGQPGQPLIGGGDIFPLMGIGARHDETVDPGLGQSRPQRGQPWRPLFGAGSRLECLEHRTPCAQTRPAGRRCGKRISPTADGKPDRPSRRTARRRCRRTCRAAHRSPTPISACRRSSSPSRRTAGIPPQARPVRCPKPPRPAVRCG